MATRNAYPYRPTGEVGVFFFLTFYFFRYNVYTTKDGKAEILDGERYYLAAVSLTDSHPGVQFREMLAHDSLKSQLERLYFQGEWRDLELMGWNTFCLKMEEAGQKRWLAKIKELDGNVILGHLETQLMQASRDGKAPNRSLLEATVKALQGVTALTKISSDAEMGGSADGIEIKFIPSLNEPVEPEEWERILAEKDPALARYFGFEAPKSELDSSAEQPEPKAEVSE